MQFVSPFFLFASLLVIAPIIIHLFNFRRYRTVYFSNVEFLNNISEETKKTSTIKHLLILLLRILVILSLVFAFAQPYIPAGENDKLLGGTVNTVSVYVDNSFSMQAEKEGGSLLVDAMKKASEIARAYKPTDEFHLVTNSFEGKHQRFVGREDFIDMLSEVNTVPAVKNISEVLKFQKEISLGKKNRIIYLISDFQKNITDVNNFLNDTSCKVVFVPIETENQANLYIDSCWFESPVQQLEKTGKLVVRVVNNSDENLEKIPVKLFINDNQKAISSISVDAYSNNTTTLTYTIRTKGIHNARLELDDYPIVYDDKLFFSYTVPENIPVLVINSSENSPYLEALFGKDSLFIYDNVEAAGVDYSLFNKYRLIILNELSVISSGMAAELSSFVGKGGGLLVFPHPSIDKASYDDFLSLMNLPLFDEIDSVDTKVGSLNVSHPVYTDVFEYKDEKYVLPKNIDLPTVFSHYSIQRKSSSIAEDIMTLENNDAFFCMQAYKKGSVYLSAAPLDVTSGDFAQHALFVPVVYNIAMQSYRAQDLYYSIGSDEVVEIPLIGKPDSPIKVTRKTDAYEIIPGVSRNTMAMRIFMHDQLKEAGNYIVNGGGDENIGIAWNYNRLESNTESYKESELRELLDEMQLKGFVVIESGKRNIKEVLKQLNNGVELWRYFMILALLLLAIEILFLRKK